MGTKMDFLLTLMKTKSVSRKKLTGDVGIAASTLSYLVDEMRRKGIVSSRNVAHGRGRPYEIVELRKDAWFGLSMKVGRESVRAVLFNSWMEAVEEEEINVIKSLRNNDGYRKLMEGLLDRFSSEDKLNCIGVSASGTVRDGKILHSPIMNVNNLDLRSLISSIFPNAFISILNDVEALANYEKREFGGNNILVINYGTGIGASFVKENENRFFELGHTVVDLDGERCYCGQKGCLETVASEYSALKRFMNREFSILDFVEYEEELFREHLDELRKLSSEDPEKAIPFFEEPLRMLSRELSNLIIILKPERISFYGEGIRKWMVEEIERNIKSILSDFRMDNLEFVCRENIPYSWEIGALSDAVEKYLESL